MATLEVSINMQDEKENRLTMGIHAKMESTHTSTLITHVLIICAPDSLEQSHLIGIRARAREHS